MYWDFERCAGFAICYFGHTGRLMTVLPATSSLELRVIGDADKSVMNILF